MRNLLRFIKVYHFVLLFLLVELFSLFLYFSNHKFQESKLLNFTQEYTDVIYDYYSSLNKYLNLHEENNYLRKENAKLYSFINQANNINENVQLFNHIHARIIDNSIRNSINIITLDKGEKDGIEIGMGVRVENGVIGIVKATSKNYSKAISVLNTNSSISIKHDISNESGKLTWNGGDYMSSQINDIPIHTNINIGDTIKTNGFSRIFPEDINMGIITSFTNASGDGFYKINMRFINNINTSKNVYIIKSLSKKEIDEIKW